MKKLILAFILTCITTIYIYQNYAESKYWNVPNNHSSEKLLFNNIFYFLIITFFTIGYGDISPKSHILKYITIVYSSLAFIIILF